MKLTALASLALLALAACQSKPKESVPLEAPNVHFKKAIVLAAVAEDKRKEVEDMVVAELLRRRPDTKVTPSYKQFPDLGKATHERFKAYVDTQDVDMVVTIVPFAEIVAARYADWNKEPHELVAYYDDLSPAALVGRFGVQVVGWDVKTKRPVYAKTSEILVGEAVGVQGVTDFAVATVSPGG